MNKDNTLHLNLDIIIKNILCKICIFVYLHILKLRIDSNCLLSCEYEVSSTPSKSIGDERRKRQKNKAVMEK